VGGLAGALVLWALLLPLPGKASVSKGWGVLAGAVLGLLWGLSNRDVILLFINRASAGVVEPILKHDAGFYLFTLPFLDSIHDLVILLALAGLALSVLYSSLTRNQGEWQMEPLVFTEDAPGARLSFHMSAALLLAALAFGKYLDRYHLLYSELGVVNGPGWTDVNVRLPLLAAAAGVALAGALVLLVPAVRDRLQRVTGKIGFMPWGGAAGALISVCAVVVASWFLLLTVVPGAFQWLMVEPNEITMESPYIKNNIELTRYGFGLDDVEEREFPATGQFTREMVENNQSTFDNIRLWDWRALDQVYKQFQEIRLYYEFRDVDIDRYTLNGDYRQVMVSAREMMQDNLPQDSQTFVNRRFKYTHGYGITMSSVSKFSEQGLPDLLIKDIPPKSRHESIEVERPQIYYGELTDSHVIVNSSEPEFDYPSGEENVYISYPGKGGVQISGFFRKFLFGWKFDGTSLLLSGYPTSESRIMFHRDIRDRIRTLAPFLKLDNDPYVVLADGRLHWIVDAYTTSTDFPYSQRFKTGQMAMQRGDFDPVFSNRQLSYLEGANYIRNSVKVVVDAFDGSVDFYVFESGDPLVKAWSAALPGLFKPREQMPDALERHIRYPSDMLLTQGLVYSKYHMTDPGVFYNQEDLWIRATEKYYGQVQPVEPYYVMWEPPGSDEPEFVLILPFTPKNRQVLIGWIAGMCDPGNYGRFLAYKFPKEKRILGPQQVETKIDQDSYLAGQLTLWDQRGSQVIRGNVLAIPVEETIFYVEPIYLQADTAAYPELRLVAMMHGDRLSYAETFEKALKGLIEDTKKPEFKPAIPDAASLQELVEQAGNAFDKYLGSLGQKSFDDASKALDELQGALDELNRRMGAETGAPASEEPGQ